MNFCQTDGKKCRTAIKSKIQKTLTFLPQPFIIILSLQVLGLVDEKPELLPILCVNAVFKVNLVWAQF